MNLVTSEKKLQGKSNIKHELFNKKIDFLTIFKKELSRKMIVLLLAI